MEDLIMKKLIMFVMVIAIAVPVFSGIASAQEWPVCFTICPPDAGVGDEVTMTGYDENGDFFDLSTLDTFESNFHHETGGYYPTLLKAGDELTNIDIVDGSVVFTLTDEMLMADVTMWDFFCVPGEDDAAFRIANSVDPEDAPFDTVAEAIAAGGTCGDLVPGCVPLPAIAVDSNDVYEPQDAGGPAAEGNQRDLLWVSLAWRPGEDPCYPNDPCYYAPVFTATVTVDPNGGNVPNEDFVFPDSVAADGSVDLTFTEANWDVLQNVVVEAVADTYREGNESYPIELTVTIDIDDPNFGNPIPVVVVSSVGVVDNDIPFVSALPDPIELSESDPCTCVDLKVRLSHKPDYDVYVRVYPEGWPFGADEPNLAEMAYLDPPLGVADDPNILTFTVTGNPTWDPCTMTSNWNVEQTITVCPIDNDELAEAWLEDIDGEIFLPSYSQDVRYLVPWWNPDGSNADDPCTPDVEEESDGEVDETIVVVIVQDNECGAWGYDAVDVAGAFNEEGEPMPDCVVNLADFAHFYNQWLICTEPYDDADVCDKFWNLVVD